MRSLYNPWITNWNWSPPLKSVHEAEASKARLGTMDVQHCAFLQWITELYCALIFLTDILSPLHFYKNHSRRAELRLATG